MEITVENAIWCLRDGVIAQSPRLSIRFISNVVRVRIVRAVHHDCRVRLLYLLLIVLVGRTDSSVFSLNDDDDDDRQTDQPQPAAMCNG